MNNPLLALQGRVPGLLIEQSSGLSGSVVKVRIQGRNTIANGSDPLYVIDGMPYPAEMPLQAMGPVGSVANEGGTATLGSGSALNYINPSDIEGIVVLKDADATAIYGSREQTEQY